ncbi:hypothetical protein SM2011_a6502 (plasmid) [Sinorhizobium meliloti 2011]|nr:hypothetical protein SM2011_a6502 [Sinorhizobium meliloti 2011]
MSTGCSPICSRRANIDDDELLAFRKLAELYRSQDTGRACAEIGTGALLEICNGD